MVPANWHQLNRTRSQKWLLSVCQFPGRAPTGFCLSSKYFKINKWVSFTYDQYVFLYGVFVLVSGCIKSVHEPFKIGVFFSCRSIVFLYVFPFGFQSQVLWGFIFLVHLSKGWRAWCGTQISHSSEKSSIAVRFLLTMNLYNWGVAFFIAGL